MRLHFHFRLIGLLAALACLAALATFTTGCGHSPVAPSSSEIAADAATSSVLSAPSGVEILTGPVSIWAESPPFGTQPAVETLKLIETAGNPPVWNWAIHKPAVGDTSG